MARTKTQVILRYLVYGVVSIALLSLVGYFLIIRPLQINKEKANFTKAETQLDALAAQIEKTIGKPDDQKKEKSCGYASRVYERGPRGCSVAYYMLFANKNAIQSTGLTSSISKLVGSSELQRLGDKKINTFVPYVEYRGDQILDQSYKDFGALTCSAQYIYPVQKKLDQPLIPKYPENIQVELTCGGPAMSEYFPTIKQ